MEVFVQDEDQTKFNPEFKREPVACSPARKQRSFLDAGGDRGEALAVDAAELASGGSRWDGLIESGGAINLSPIPSPADHMSKVTRLRGSFAVCAPLSTPIDAKEVSIRRRPR